MINPVQITFRNTPQSGRIEAKIRDRVRRLDRYHAGIVSCRVMFEQLHHRHRQGNLFHVRVDVGVPGAEIVVGQERHDRAAREDPMIAIREAFDALDRRLEDHGRRQGNQEKRHLVPAHGTVVQVSPDHGFIRAPDGREIYFHRNSVVEGYDDVDVGTKVRFDLYEGEGVDGPQASTVHPLGKRNLPPVEVS